jgi:hypothetical protein
MSGDGGFPVFPSHPGPRMILEIFPKILGGVGHWQAISSASSLPSSLQIGVLLFKIP